MRPDPALAILERALNGDEQALTAIRAGLEWDAEERSFREYERRSRLFRQRLTGLGRRTARPPVRSRARRSPRRAAAAVGGDDPPGEPAPPPPDRRGPLPAFWRAA